MNLVLFPSMKIEIQFIFSYSLKERTGHSAIFGLCLFKIWLLLLPLLFPAKTIFIFELEISLILPIYTTIKIFFSFGEQA